MLGADLIIVLDGNMDPYGPVHRQAIVSRAMENQCFAVLVNRVGTGRGLSYPGESVAVDPFGSVLVDATESHPVTVALDLNRIAESRKDYRYLRDRRAFPQTTEQALTEDGVANVVSVIPGQLPSKKLKPDVSHSDQVVETRRLIR